MQDATAAEEKNQQRRYFTLKQREECWNQAKTVPNRDAERWRVDAANNVVFKKFIGCQGCLCYEFDHIVPYSKGGTTTISNCQILQTRVNRSKSDTFPYSTEEMQAASCALYFSERELDMIELALYGQVNRKGATYTVRSKKDQQQQEQQEFNNYKT